MTGHVRERKVLGLCNWSGPNDKQGMEETDAYKLHWWSSEHRIMLLADKPRIFYSLRHDIMYILGGRN